MNNNQTLKSIFDLNSYISEDWYGGYKLEVDLTGKTLAKDWKLDFNLPDFKIRGAYGVDLVDKGNGNYSFSGEGGWQDLDKGETAKAIFIIDDYGKNAKVPEFTLQGAQTSTPSENTIEPEAPATPQQAPQTADPIINTNASVTEDWYGGYKLEVDLTGGSQVNDWKMNFDLPDYKIRGAYGVDLVNEGNGSYSFSGQGGWEDLDKGETAKAIFIIDDYGKNAKVPEFKLQGSTISAPLEPVEPPKNTVETPQTPTEPPKNSGFQLSPNAITAGFENHANNTTYNLGAQQKDWDANWSSDDMNSNAVISSNEAYSGNQSLKITYPDDRQFGAGALWEIPAAKEYYLSYQVKFAENFDFNGKYDWSSGGKLPGLGADGLCSGGATCNGTNGFTSRPMWREDGRAVLYLYHMDKPGTYGEDLLLKGNDGKDNYFEPGKWHNITQRVRINDGNQSNGSLDVWMDQEQVLSKDNIKFVTNGQQIDIAYFSTFHGGSGSDWWPENDVNAYFDDFVVSTNAADVGL